MLKILNSLKKLAPLPLKKKLANNVKIQKFRYWLGYAFYMKGKLNSQLSPNFDIKDCINSGNQVRVLLPLIETNHYQYYHLLALAKALEIRGAQVKVLICGQLLDGCELKSIRNEGQEDPCWKCRFNENNIVPLFDFNIINMANIFNESEVHAFNTESQNLALNDSMDIVKHGVNLKQSIDDSVVRYFYGAVSNDKKEVFRVRADHTKTALMSIAVAKKIDQDWSPQIVLSNMPCYSAWEAYYRYFDINGKRFRQIAMSQFEFNSVVYNSFELFPADQRFRKYLRTRERNELTAIERNKLYEFISVRHSGNANIFKNDGYFRQSNSLSAVEDKLHIDKSKRNIFLFSNLYWDVGLSDRKGLFDGVLDWVIQTIEIVKLAPHCHLYIKPHPAEVFGSAGSLKGVSEIIKEKYPESLNNVTIIEPDWKLVTYDLFPHIDLGVIFTGTLGLEMALSDIAVVSTGTTSHKGLGIAAEPESIESYRAMLLGEGKLPKVDKDYLELFAYFYFIRTLIPWTLTKQAYADNFDGFAFESLDDLKPGKDPYLDHLCNCILDPINTVPEAWLE